MSAHHVAPRSRETVPHRAPRGAPGARRAAGPAAARLARREAP